MFEQKPLSAVKKRKIVKFVFDCDAVMTSAVPLVAFTSEWRAIVPNFVVLHSIVLEEFTLKNRIVLDNINSKIVALSIKKRVV